MNNAYYYRFELGLKGENQGIGFLQGIDEIGLEIQTEIMLLDFFEELPCPTLHFPCEFWFTSEGLKHFSEALSIVDKTIRECGWYLVYAQKKADPETAAYRDEWQAAWTIKRPQKHIYHCFDSFSDFLKSINT